MPRVKLSEQLEQQKQRYEQLQRIFNICRYNPGLQNGVQELSSEATPIPLENQLVALRELERIANTENERLKEELATAHAELFTTRTQLNALKQQLSTMIFQASGGPALIQGFMADRVPAVVEEQEEVVMSADV